MLVHVYGVVRAGSPVPDQPTGRGGHPVRFVEDEEFRVLVGDVPDDDRVGRADLLAHAHLLESFVALTTVVPLQFGVVLPDDDTVRREFLSSRRDDIDRLLNAFDGLVQLSVTASYDEQEVLREVLRRHPRLAAHREAGLGDPASRMALGEAVAHALEAQREEDAQRVFDAVSPWARAVAAPEVRGAYDVADLALLVERDHQPKVDEAITDLRDSMAPRMRLRYVGPQPPYHFVTSVEVGDPTWA